MIQQSTFSSNRRLGLCAALILVGLTTLAGVVRGQTASPVVTIENFGRVNESYYRGGQPREKQIVELKQLGIKTIVDLRKDKKTEEAGWAAQAGIQYFNIPLVPSKAANEEQTNYFLSLVNNPANWPVYVHCKGGRHRTGALTAVYRITHDGWNAQQAFDEMLKYDFNDSWFGGPSSQKKFVFAFYERYRK